MRTLIVVVAAVLIQSAGLLSGEQEIVLRPDPELKAGLVSGLEIRDGQLTLYRLEDAFKADSRAQYKISGSTDGGKDEFGIVNSITDAAMVTLQPRPDACLLLETHDNDGLSLGRDVVPTVKGVLSFDIWPLRFWPTSGRLNINLSENGQRVVNYALAASDYKNPSTKTFDGKTLSAPGGRPYFSSMLNSDIYQPSYPIPKSEQRWWPVRLLFRPDYVAGSLDGSVCREIKDPERRPILVRRLEINLGQLETCLRALRFKALLGETISAPLALKGAKWTKLSWAGTAPEKTRVGVQIRAADSEDELKTAAWSGPAADKPYFLEAGAVPAAVASKKLLQVRVLLKAEQDAPFEVVPTLESVKVVQE